MGCRARQPDTWGCTLSPVISGRGAKETASWMVAMEVLSAGGKRGLGVGALQQMGEVICWGEDDCFSPEARWKVSQMPGDEPCSRLGSERQEDHICLIGPQLRPRLRIGEMHALFDQKIEPQGRKRVAAKLASPHHLPIFIHDCGTGDEVNRVFKHPVHYQFCRGPVRVDCGGDDDIGVEYGEPHAGWAGGSVWPKRIRSISRLISSLEGWSLPSALS